MSFSVKRYKNGRPELIKVSFWDAFKGVPSPKPRAKKACPCCHQVHARDKTQSDATDGPAANEKKHDSKAEATDQRQTRTNREVETYSSADDMMITEMKAAGDSWKKILAAINKESVSQLKEHWKTINPDGKDKADDRPDHTEEKPKQKNALKSDTDRQAEIAKKKAEGQAKKAQTKKREAQDVQKTAAAAAKKLTKKAILEVEPKTQRNSMQVWAERFDQQKWLAAASKHFDITGERISPETARKMAEGKL